MDDLRPKQIFSLLKTAGLTSKLAVADLEDEPIG